MTEAQRGTIGTQWRRGSILPVGGQDERTEFTNTVKQKSSAHIIRTDKPNPNIQLCKSFSPRVCINTISGCSTIKI